MSKWTEARARTPLVSVRNIDVTFGNGRNAFKAVDNVSFDIHRGENFGLVGESGSGKSTIGSMIVDTYGPTSGSITFNNDTDISRSSQSREPDLKKKIQLQQQAECQ